CGALEEPFTNDLIKSIHTSGTIRLGVGPSSNTLIECVDVKNKTPGNEYKLSSGLFHS
ncbi:hypothetical protein J6590_091799, partial [Homalodisca vitripennis]